MKFFVFVAAFLGSYLLRAQDCYVFIGSYNRDSNKDGIYVYKLDTISGNLSFVSAAPHILNPAYLDISPDGRYVYACTEALIEGGGKVSSFSFDPAKGNLTFINEQSSEGENPVYLAVHKSGKWVVNGNYTGGSLSVFLIAADGRLSAASQVINFTDSSINSEQRNSAHIHAAVFSPDGNYVFAPDLGADKIRCFVFDPFSTKPLQAATNPFITTTLGSGPRHFTFHPNGRFCYCVEELAGTVSAYSYKDGKLEAVQRVMAHEKGSITDYHSADIHLSPDGQYLYASNRGKENNIAIFSVDQQTGKLVPKGYQSTLGNHPRNFAIEPTGKFLLVANQISGNVVIFKRNAQTGALTKTGNKIKIPGASCVKIRYYP